MERPYRYPGSRPFTFEERNLFFGRDDDIEKLKQLVSLENLVVLYGKSGLGKTSLLNAGVIPSLNELNTYEFIMNRFGAYLPESSFSPYSNFIHNLLPREVKESFIYTKLIKPEDITGQQLWYLFKNLQLINPQKKGFIVVFDQFEELFTYPEVQVLEFKKEVAELINMNMPPQLSDILTEKLEDDRDFLTEEEANFLFEPINLKIIFAIRSDKLSLMNRLTDYLPNILKKYYELLPLNGEQATSAIVKPAQLKDHEYWTPTFTFAPDALKEIIRFLSKDGQETVESFLLQIVCHYVETTVKKGNLEIVTLNDLGDLQNISKSFYQDLIAQLKPDDQLPARIFIEEGLIFEDDLRRLSLYEGQIFKQYHISKEVLKTLLDSHLLRSEPFHSGGFSYELSHDTLVLPILHAKSIRKQEENMQKELMRQQEEVHQFFISRFNDFKNRSILLQEEDLKYLKPYESGLSLTDEQKKFIEKSIRAVRRGKNNKRNRILIGGGGLLVLIILSAFTFFLVTKNSQIDEERRIAEAQTKIAENQTEISKQKAQRIEKQKKNIEVQKLIAEQKKKEADSLKRVAQNESKKAAASEKRAQQQAALANYQKLKADSANADLDSLVNLSGETIRSSTEIIRLIKSEIDKEQKGTQSDSMALTKISSIVSINGAKIQIFQKGYIMGLYVMLGKNPYEKGSGDFDMWEAGYKYGQIEAKKK